MPVYQKPPVFIEQVAGLLYRESQFIPGTGCNLSSNFRCKNVRVIRVADVEQILPRDLSGRKGEQRRGVHMVFGTKLTPARIKPDKPLLLRVEALLAKRPFHLPVAFVDVRVRRIRLEREWVVTRLNRRRVHHGMPRRVLGVLAGYRYRRFASVRGRNGGLAGGCGYLLGAGCGWAACSSALAESARRLRSACATSSSALSSISRALCGLVDVVREV